MLMVGNARSCSRCSWSASKECTTPLVNIELHHSKPGVDRLATNWDDIYRHESYNVDTNLQCPGQVTVSSSLSKTLLL